MQITVYNSLPEQAADIEIRWPGTAALNDWPGLKKYSALHITIDEQMANDSAEAYSAYMSECLMRDPERIGIQLIDDREVSRFVIARLLIRNWARLLHGDRIDVVVSDEPRATSRVRTHKALFDVNLRALALFWEQREIVVGPQASVLLNRITVNSSMQYSATSHLALWDTFRSFGVYDWPKSSGDALLSRVGDCYGEQQRIWQWELGRLLPAVCTDSESLFFLQGVASETALQLIVYLPLEQLQAHLEIANTQFGAKT